MAVFLSVHCLLSYACLYLLVHVRIGEAEHQPVGPALVCQSELCHHCLVVIGVVEALYAVELLCVDALRAEVEHRSINSVAVVGVVLKGVYLIGKAVLERLSEVYVRLMCIE